MKRYTPARSPFVGMTLTNSYGEEVIIIREYGRARGCAQSFWVAPVYADGTIGPMRVSVYTRAKLAQAYAQTSQQLSLDSTLLLTPRR